MRATFDPQLKQRKPEEGQVHLPAGSRETNNGRINLISSHSCCRRHTFRSVSEFYHFLFGLDAHVSISAGPDCSL